MSKVKAPKSKGIPSKHLHARTTFLYQAATYLTLQSPAIGIGPEIPHKENSLSQQVHSPLALQLGSDLQQVSRKGQLRLSVDIKRSLCKGCNAVLIPGQTATQSILNMSKGGKKPWADVVVVECNFCGGKKRFPVGTKRQEKRPIRKVATKETPSTISMEDVQQSDTANPTTIEVDSNT